MIYIAAGHRGPGTGANGYLDEGKETIRLRNAITARLNTLAHDLAICEDNDDAQLSAVIRDVNKRCKNTRKDLAVEIHFNSSSRKDARGVETVVADKHSIRSHEFAIDLNRATVEALGIPDRTRGRGYRTESEIGRSGLAFVENTKCPACILEICFVSNKEDADAYRANFDRLVDSLCEAIQTWRYEE